MQNVNNYVMHLILDKMKEKKTINVILMSMHLRMNQFTFYPHPNPIQFPIEINSFYFHVTYCMFAY